jgi:hypothetical protein
MTRRMIPRVVGEDQPVPDQSEKHRSAELLGELARELSTLVRRDVEVAAAERLPTLRTALLDATVVSAVAGAALFALAALSVAGGLLAAMLLPGWAAALIVAAFWGVVVFGAAAVLLRPRAQPREQEVAGLLQMLASDEHLSELRSSREEARDEAEGEMRETSSALVRTLLDESVEHQVKALPHVAKREAERAEANAVDVVADAVSMLAAPARVGWRALERLVEPPPARRPASRPGPHDAGGRRRSRRRPPPSA